MTRRRCFFLLFLAPAFGSKSLRCQTLTTSLALAEHLFGISRQPVLLHKLAWSCSGSIDLKPPNLQTNRKTHEKHITSDTSAFRETYRCMKLFWLLWGVDNSAFSGKVSTDDVVRRLKLLVLRAWICFDWQGAGMSQFLSSACEAKTGRQIGCGGQLENFDPSKINTEGITV